MKTKLKQIKIRTSGFEKVELIEAEVVNMDRRFAIIELKVASGTKEVYIERASESVIVVTDAEYNFHESLALTFSDFPGFDVFSAIIEETYNGIATISVVLLKYEEENPDASFLCTSIRIEDEYEDLMETLEKETTVGFSYKRPSIDPEAIFCKIYLNKTSGELTWSGVEMVDEDAQNVSVEEFIKFAVENFPAKVDYYYTKADSLLELAKLLQDVEDLTEVTWSNGSDPTQMDVFVRDFLMLSVEKGVLTRGGSNVDWGEGDLVYRQVMPGEFLSRAKEIRPKKVEEVEEKEVEEKVEYPAQYCPVEVIAEVVVTSLQERDEFLKDLAKSSSVKWRSGESPIGYKWVPAPKKDKPVYFQLLRGYDDDSVYLGQDYESIIVGVPPQLYPGKTQADNFIDCAAQLCPHPDAYTVVFREYDSVFESLQLLQKETLVLWNSGQLPTAYTPGKCTDKILIHFDIYRNALTTGMTDPSRTYKEVELYEFIQIVKNFCPKN